MSKGEKMYGGLIRRDKRVKTDDSGNTTTQHWDGRKDVTVQARAIRVRTTTNESG